MKVIVLKGENDSGKTQTLKIVYVLLLKEGYKQADSNNFQYLDGNGDFIDILEFKGKKIGIVTQGDYSEGENSVKNHLKKLKDYDHNCGCDIAICACTIGKNIEKTILEDYPKARSIDKTTNEKVSLRLIENTQKAMEIIKILNDWLSNATE